MALRRHLLAVLTLIPVVGLAVDTASAEVKVSGDVDALTIEAHDASLGEVFAAVESATTIHIAVSGSADRAITGTFRGALPRVLSRILDGHSYVSTFSANRIRIVFIAGQSEKTARAPRPSPVVSSAKPGPVPNVDAASTLDPRPASGPPQKTAVADGSDAEQGWSGSGSWLASAPPSRRGAAE